MKEKRKRGANYYASRSLSKAERRELGKAAETKGLWDEIALLRSRLKAAMTTDQKKARRDLRLAAYGIEVLTRAVLVQSKVSPGDKDMEEQRWLEALADMARSTFNVAIEYDKEGRPKALGPAWEEVKAKAYDGREYVEQRLIDYGKGE